MTTIIAPLSDTRPTASGNVSMTRSPSFHSLYISLGMVSEYRSSALVPGFALTAYRLGADGRLRGNSSGDMDNLFVDTISLNSYT